MNLIVGISDWKVGRPNDVIITYALGSCVGICLYDKKSRVAGLSHIMLPESKSGGEASVNRMKFADTAIPDMYNKMLSMGAVHSNLTAKIAGGALMFNITSDRFNIGERNVASVKNALSLLKIPIIAHDTGLNYGRTVFFYSEDGSVRIKSTVKGERVL